MALLCGITKLDILAEQFVARRLDFFGAFATEL